MNHSAHLPRSLSIAILIIAATLFASNHISARFAFDDGTGLLFAVLARASMALAIMTALALFYRNSFRVPKHLRKWQLLQGVLIALQSLCLYTAITQIPVALALLLVNTWPMMFILASWLLKKSEPSTITLLLLALILFGLYWVLDLPEHQEITLTWILGVIFGTLSAIFIAGAMWLSQYQLGSLPGAVRSAYTMVTVIAVCAVVGASGWIEGGLSAPSTSTGWIAVLSLALLYGTASTLLFALAPKLDMAHNSPMLNVEPVASLFLAYWLLGQTLTHSQLVGGAIVVTGIIAIGMKRKPNIRPS